MIGFFRPRLRACGLKVGIRCSNFVQNYRKVRLGGCKVGPCDHNVWGVAAISDCVAAISASVHWIRRKLPHIKFSPCTCSTKKILNTKNFLQKSIIIRSWTHKASSAVGAGGNPFLFRHRRLAPCGSLFGYGPTPRWFSLSLSLSNRKIHSLSPTLCTTWSCCSQPC